MSETTSAQLTSVVIIGASGNIGRLILDGFAGKSEFNVTVLSRSSSNATFPPWAKVRKTDYSQEDLVAVFTGQDAVVSVMGMEGFSLQKRFVDAAVVAGVKRFIPSEFSFNSLSPAVRDLLPFVVDQKVEVLEYLKQKSSETPSFTWTAIWTGMLLDWCLDNGFMEFNLASKTATIWDKGDVTFTTTNVDQMQRAVIAVLERPTATQNKNLYVASVETTQNDILAALQKIAGGEWTVKNTTTSEEIQAGREAASKGDFAGVLKLVRATSFANIPDLRGNYVHDEVFGNEILGLSMESAEDTVARAVAAKK